MLTLELPAHIETIIIQTAQKQGISVSELMLNSFKQQHSLADHYPQGDVRRLKGMINTQIQAGMDDINHGIELGALYGER